jgi:hypothetical protein
MTPQTANTTPRKNIITIMLGVPFDLKSTVHAPQFVAIAMFIDNGQSDQATSTDGDLFMAVSTVYPYKCADILSIEISRNCLITGYPAPMVTNFKSWSQITRYQVPLKCIRAYKNYSRDAQLDR